VCHPHAQGAERINSKKTILSSSQSFSTELNLDSSVTRTL
jgi:hypothetical protein